MKKAITLLLIIILLGSLFGADSKTDLQKQNLKGKVKKLIVDDSYYYFRTDGNYDYESYDDGYEYFGDVYYTYNDKGQLVSMEDEDYYEGVIYGKYLSYNDAGLLSKITVDDYGLESSTQFTYNDKNQMIWKKEFDSNAVLETATEYTYDKDGNSIKESYYDKDMKLSNFTEFSYDKAKNIVERSNYLPPKILQTKKSFKYDAQNRIVEEASYTGTTLDYKEQKFYDEQGSEAKNIYFDAKKNNTRTITYTYTYDTMGNWTNRTQVTNGVEVGSKERTIEYYGN